MFKDECHVFKKAFDYEYVHKLNNIESALVECFIGNGNLNEAFNLASIKFGFDKENDSYKAIFDSYIEQLVNAGFIKLSYEEPVSLNRISGEKGKSYPYYIVLEL
jgi:hypothetical protein